MFLIDVFLRLPTLGLLFCCGEELIGVCIEFGIFGEGLRCGEYSRIDQNTNGKLNLNRCGAPNLPKVKYIYPRSREPAHKVVFVIKAKVTFRALIRDHDQWASDSC